MERLFTSITNAGVIATQNENMMQTGYYAESRNDDCKYATLATQEDFDRF